MEANFLTQISWTSLAQVLFASIWQGLLLTAVVWVCLKLTPGLRASTRYSLWLVVFLVVALLPGLGLFTGLPEFRALGIGFGGGRPVGFSLHLSDAWAFGFEALWGAASLLSAVQLFLSARQMRRLREGSAAVPFCNLEPAMKIMLARSGQDPVEIRLSDAVDAPIVLGFLRPAVVMPRGLWSELTAEELQHVVLHEMAHLKRGDDWTNLLQKLLRALLPLNPALFWAERHLCREREQACDDAVLDAAGNPRAYATCLTRLAETRLVRRAASLAPGLWKRRSELAGRVENILHRRRITGPVVSRGLVAACLLVTVGGVVLLQRCPRLITFGGSDAPQGGTASSAFQGAVGERPVEARYQEAVFHPQANTNQSVAESSAADHQTSVRKTRMATRAQASGGSRFVQQFVQVRSTVDESGQRLTLTIFTLEVPRTSKRSPVGSRQTLPSPLLNPDSWIFFQI